MYVLYTHTLRYKDIHIFNRNINNSQFEYYIWQIFVEFKSTNKEYSHK